MYISFKKILEIFFYLDHVKRDTALKDFPQQNKAELSIFQKVSSHFPIKIWISANIQKIWNFP